MSRSTIRVDGLSKRFLIGARVKQADTLGETVAFAAAHQLQRLRTFFVSGGWKSKTGDEEFWALREVSFEAQPGEVLGIIGRNGSGKSTLLKVLSRVTPPTEGEATIVGRVGSLLEVGTGFHGELTGRENIYLNGTILGMKKAEIDKRFDEIVAFSGVEKFIETPVKHYSSGMYLRLAFAVAAHLRTEILLIDEVLAVGDAAFQKTCIEKMSEVAREGRTVLFVSHNLGAVSQLCSQGMVLEAGRVAAQGSVDEAMTAYGQLVTARSDEEEAHSIGGVGISALRVHTASPTLDPATPLSFSFSISIQKEYWNILVQLCVVTHEGTTLVLEAIDGKRLPELLRPGRYRVAVDLPPLWLRPRSYASRVKVIAYPQKGTSERFFSEWLDIAVACSDDVESIPERLLAPRAQWSVRDVVGKTTDSCEQVRVG